MVASVIFHAGFVFATIKMQQQKREEERAETQRQREEDRRARERFEQSVQTQLDNLFSLFNGTSRQLTKLEAEHNVRTRAGLPCAVDGD